VAPAIRCRKRRWGAAHLVDYAQHRSIRNGQRDPVMAVWGTIRNSGPQLEEMMREVANEVTGFVFPPPRTGSPKKIPQSSQLVCSSS
jgi:hypothetical protein